MLPPRVRLAAAAAAGLVLVALVVAVRVRHGTPFAADAAAHRWMLARRGRALTDVAVVVTDSGTSPWAQILAAVAGALAVPRRWWWRGALVGLAALVVGQQLRLALALAVDRARPPIADWAVHATGPALPSGHTTTSALVAAGLVAAVLRRTPPGRARTTAATIAVAALAAVWAVAVGVTRVYLGVHWPTDVAAGWLLAAVLAGVALPPLGALLARLAPETETEHPSGTAGPDHQS